MYVDTLFSTGQIQPCDYVNFCGFCWKDLGGLREEFMQAAVVEGAVHADLIIVQIRLRVRCLVIRLSIFIYFYKTYY